MSPFRGISPGRFFNMNATEITVLMWIHNGETYLRYFRKYSLRNLYRGLP
jgi:hypothetical protein